VSEDTLNLSSLNGLLRTRVLGKSAANANEVWESIESTNSRALELAKSGAAEGVIIAAREQTAGRGRQGRRWVSPPDSGLYISFLLRPEMARAKLPLISLATGVAVTDAITRVAGIQVGLKWVNDIVYSGRKLGGILAEMTPDAAGAKPALVVGIGINLRLDPSDVPDEIRQRIDWLERIAGSPIDPNQLAAQLAWSLERIYQTFEQGNFEAILKEWKNHSVTLGQKIRSQSNNTSIEGEAIDLGDDGSLIVRLDDGTTTHLHAGEVSIRMVDGSYA
jgi:BirA family transcriptional regulator, biotin operon repressor / biotin---[acetyl-CoA-carboxylase] ligase